jgi:hypothetical protein
MSETEQNSATPRPVQQGIAEIPVHLIKGSNFRVIHADGVWFGGSPYGGMHLTFYSERFPIPKKLVLRFDQAGQAVEDESKRESKEGFIREMEVDIVLSPEAAMALYESLSVNLKIMRDTMKAKTQS